jgi:hypothetical protein
MALKSLKNAKKIRILKANKENSTVGLSVRHEMMLDENPQDIVDSIMKPLGKVSNLYVMGHFQEMLLTLETLPMSGAFSKLNTSHGH